MVLRRALEQVRHQLVEGIGPLNGAPSTLTPLQLAVESYLDVNVEFHDSEFRILKSLREQGRIHDNQVAYVEPGCREHDVVHVCVNGGLHWIEVQRDGTILDL
jgi:hypothetical protein